MSSETKNKFSLKKRLQSFKHAFHGIFITFRTQHNAWIHCLAIVFVLALGFTFHVTTTEWFVLFLCTGMVLSAEIFNTSIEHLVDFISPEYNEKAGHIKDLSAAAVLITAIVSAIIGLWIFIPKVNAIITSWSSID
jgi:diacylglycerol kinase (ATP)